MHVASPAPVVVLPPLAPGYAWTLTAHGWCPQPYSGPALAPMPATSSNPAPSASAPDAPASSPPAAPALKLKPPPPATLLADVSPEVRAMAAQDRRVASALVDLLRAREAFAMASRLLMGAIPGPTPQNKEQFIARVVELLPARSDVRGGALLALLAGREVTRAEEALSAAVQPRAAERGEHDAHGLTAPNATPAPPEPIPPPPPAVTAPASEPEPTTPPRLDAAHLDAAQRLRAHDPAVARALAAYTAATEHAQAAAETFTATLEPHGPGPDEPHARATWVRQTAERDPLLAMALRLALSAVDDVEHTAAQLAAALLPYAPRAPPRA